MTKEQKHQEFVKKIQRRESEFPEPKYESYYTGTRGIMMGMFYALCEKHGYDIEKKLTELTR